MGGSLGKADAQENGGGIFRDREPAFFEFLAEVFLPLFARVRGEACVLEKLEPKGTVEIGYSRDTLGELADGIVKERVLLGGRGRSEERKREREQERQTREGTVEKGSHGVLRLS